MSLPTQSIFPLENAKLITDLDCNNLQLINLDESNLSGGGGSGNDTGTTVAILKGDGNHGFADAVAGTDYATAGDVAGKEDQSAHDADILTLTTAVDLTEADIVTLTTAVGTKANAAATTASLALKADDADLQAYITSNDADVALKAYITDVDDALAFKADASGVTTSLSLKEDLLPTTSFDGYILSRNIDGTWHLVDPVTLGTTSQTFTDGQSFTNTNYDSATAAFVAGDVGKTITCAGVIPDNTTIVSRTSATRVVLSAPTLSTATGETFTIINRLLTNNTGTVTSVSLTNNVTTLFTSSVSNPTSSPTITLNPASSVGANTFYGNFTGFAGTAGFGSAAAARTSLGGTTAGQALFQLANPSAITFPRINADNTVSTRTAAQLLVDLGAESALTFSAPLARSTNTISIPAATSLVSGHLTATDFQIFTAKVPNTRNINTTAPLTGGGSLITDRTIAMPVATASVDGYLTQGDFTTFTNKVPQTRTVGVTAPLTVTNLGQLNANITLAMPSATVSRDGYLTSTDYNSFAAGAGKSVTVAAEQGPTITLGSTIPPITRVVLGSSGTQLTAAMTITLPLASGYTTALNNPPIEFVDITPNGIQTTNFRLTIARSGSDLIDGATSLQLPQGQRYIRFNSDVGARWTSTKYFAESFRDPSDASKQVRVVFPTSPVAFPANTTLNLNLAPSGDSVTVVPETAVAGSVVRGISASGTIISSALSATEIVPTEQTMDDADTSVTNNGTVDTVKITTALTATRSLTLPFVTLYSSGEVLRIYDSTGNPNNQALRVRGAINGITQELINSNASIDLNQGVGLSFNRTFIADPINHRWSVEAIPGSNASGLSVDPWHLVTSASGLATLTCSTSVVENHHILNVSGQNTTLTMGGSIIAGSTGRIRFVDATGAHTITIPAGTSRLPTAEASSTGVFTLSTGTDIEDEWGWDYDGTKFNFFPLGKKFVGAAAPSFAVTDVDKNTAITTTGASNQGNVTNTRYGLATKFVADGGVGAGVFYTVGSIKLALFRAGATATPGWNIRCAILADSGGIPVPIASGGLIGSASDAIAAGSLNTVETLTTFNPNASVASGSTYWISLYDESVAAADANSFVSWANHAPTASFANYRSQTGTGWTAITTNTLMKYITYRNS